jgi:hypothetical protein
VSSSPKNNQIKMDCLFPKKYPVILEPVHAELVIKPNSYRNDGITLRVTTKKKTIEIGLTNIFDEYRSVPPIVPSDFKEYDKISHNNFKWIKVSDVTDDFFNRFIRESHRKKSIESYNAIAPEFHNYYISYEDPELYTENDSSIFNYVYAVDSKYNVIRVNVKTKKITKCDNLTLEYPSLFNRIKCYYNSL